MPHSCGDLDVPVISVCGTEILMEKFDIQKLVVYATDLDEKNTSRTGFWPFRTRDGQIEDWNKKLNLLRFAAYGFVDFFRRFCSFLDVTADFFSLKAKQKANPIQTKANKPHTHDKGAFHPSKAPSNSMKISSKNI